MQQNSESTYQGGESMQKIKAKENMQDPETCRGCVQRVCNAAAALLLWQLPFEPETV